MADVINESDFIFYKGEDGQTNVRVILGDETVWVTQKSMGEMFGTSKQNISLHLQNIFTSEELNEISVVKEILTTAADGKKYATKFYNLDAVIAVGYRVNTYKATKFRQWATSVLKEYLLKGFVLDDERLKQGGKLFGKDYFKELLQRVRSIRASERRIYQQVTDIFAECSIDYDPDADTTKSFYAMVQNKFHFAITGKTAAEIIYSIADNQKQNMGLSTWKNAPDGRILKGDVIIAKKLFT